VKKLEKILSDLQKLYVKRAALDKQIAATEQKLIAESKAASKATGQGAKKPAAKKPAKKPPVKK